MNCIQLKNLIPNQFNSERWSHEKKYQFKKLSKEKKIAIKRLWIDRKKFYEGWNYKNKTPKKWPQTK